MVGQYYMATGKMISLTSEEAIEILIRINEISCVRQYSNGTKVVMENGDFEFVKESAGHIQEIINEIEQ